MAGRWMNAVEKMPDGTWKIHRDIWNLAASPPR